MMIAEFPGIEEIKLKIDSAKWFKFNKLPVDNVEREKVISEIGLIPYIQIQSEYLWESTISLWCNRIHEYQKNPYELKSGFQIEDIGDMFRTQMESRIDKSDYDMWLPVYEYLKNKLQ